MHAQAGRRLCNTPVPLAPYSVGRAELVGCGVGDAFVSAYAAHATHPATALVLSNNHITDAGLTALCGAASRGIRRLDVAYNCITSDGALAVAACLEDLRSCSLEHFNLEGNHVDVHGARAIAQAAASAMSLISVNASYVSSEAPQLSAWAPALRAGRLQALELAQLTTQSAEVCGPTVLRALCGGMRMWPSMKGSAPA